MSRRGGRRGGRGGGSGGRREAGSPGGGPGATRIAGIAFRRAELRDLAVAWVALSVAFAVLFAGGGNGVLGMAGAGQYGELSWLFLVSFLTAGVGFLLHELAHKVVAIRYGQAAVFRANYQMLGLGVLVALAGFIYAAPGAVYHAGRVSDRQRGLVALAGPLTNVALSVLFGGALFAAVGAGSTPVFEVALYGLAINALLAGFNMIPFGPLDGATVVQWSTVAYVAAAVPCLLLGVGGFLLLGML